MRLPNFEDIFASTDFVMSLDTQKKAVRFAPETNFQPGRPLHEFGRAHPQYVPGKYSCPSGAEWENTSKMNDKEYQLLHMVVHAEHRVRDGQEASALSRSFKVHIQSGKPLPPGSEIPLHLSMFRDQVLDRFRDIVSDTSIDILDEWNSAKVLIVYKDHDDDFMFFQFLEDRHEELEAREWMLELKSSIPPENVGVQRTTMLRLLREAWLAEVCGADPSYR
jgi:hypothetical protein